MQFITFQEFLSESVKDSEIKSIIEKNAKIMHDAFLKDLADLEKNPPKNHGGKVGVGDTDVSVSINSVNYRRYQEKLDNTKQLIYGIEKLFIKLKNAREVGFIENTIINKFDMLEDRKINELTFVSLVMEKLDITPMKGSLGKNKITDELIKYLTNVKKEQMKKQKEVSKSSSDEDDDYLKTLFGG